MAILKEQRELIDPETGETVNVISFIPEVKDKHYLKVFSLMSRKVLEDLKDSGLNGATATLWWLIDKLMSLPVNTGPEIYAHPADIAKAIGIGRSQVYLHLKKLKALGYIRQISARQHVYVVNPDMLFKGSLVKFRKDLIEKYIKREE